MEELFTAVSTSRISNQTTDDFFVELPEVLDTLPRETGRAFTPEIALEVLRGEPDYLTLVTVLRFLAPRASINSSFTITRPAPIAAQLVNVLLSDIVPSYWAVLDERQGKTNKKTFKNASERRSLLSCLKSVTGLNALLARLKELTEQTKAGNKKAAKLNQNELLQLYLDVLQAVLQGDGVIRALWNDMHREPMAFQKALWRETVILIGGGKILNIAAEVSSILNKSNPGLMKQTWIADGHLYSRWLVRNAIQGADLLRSVPEGTWKPLPELLNKCLRLGYSSDIVDGLLNLILCDENDCRNFTAILESLGPHEQQLILNGALRLLSSKFLPSSTLAKDTAWWQEDSRLIGAAARYLKVVVSEDATRQSHLVTWLTSSSGAGIGDSVGIRRAAIAALSDSKQNLEGVLEKSLQYFGDQLYIRHSPSIQQEVHCQVLLLAAGYVHRASATKLSGLLRSSGYLTAISNRLAASSERARFLGMIVGETFSSLVDKPDKRMDFKMDELQSTEAKWYKSLIYVSDHIGDIALLREGPESMQFPKRTIAVAPSQVSLAAELQDTKSKVKVLVGLDDEEHNMENTNLIPYDKPDTDEDDSDEDPTLIQRNKPAMPVYIRDLILYLRDSENYDRQKLGLSTASSLIRRKAGFGTEVSAHVEELATLLVGIHDKFDMENFQDMRLQGMIAVLLSQPSKMGPWFARTFFEGDYSISQRASVLTVLGVSARELGGFKEQDASLRAGPSIPLNSFPSKELPPKLHKLYGQPNAIEVISEELSNTLIQPLAASLADKATGPDILKVRTFSSRLAVEAKRKRPAVNALSTIVANSFFFPLTGRFAAHFKAYGAKNVIFEPLLLSSYLKALSLIFHAGGTSTLQLPQMTSELWDLLLSLKTVGQTEKCVGEAIMLGFLTILEMNADQRRLAEVLGRELVETQRWVEGMFQRLGSGSGEDDKLRSLAAGVILRIRDMVEKYQALLVGEMASF